MLQQNPNAAIKLAPATRWPTTKSAEVECEWLGYGRECLQQVAWSGTLSESTCRRRATVLDAMGNLVGSMEGVGGETAEVGPLSAFVIEPHPAVIAAQLQGAFANLHQLRFLQPGVAYLTAARPVWHCGAASFEVLAALPFDQRMLRQEFRSRGLYPAEVKKRGVDVAPAEIARRYRGLGEQPCTLILTPIKDRILAVIAVRREPE